VDAPPPATRDRAPQAALLYTILVPAYNEERNIVPTVRALVRLLRAEAIPFEILIVNDNSSDNTAAVLTDLRDELPEVRTVLNQGPRGLGRAIRAGIPHFQGDVLAVVMADGSDHPADVVRCYRLIEAGYDCVFGSRFMRDSHVTHYPPVKLLVNRLVNRMMQLMFFTRHNDLTNAFKVYRRHVIESISPLHAAHFNITIEMSLSALIRDYSIAALPITWSGRTWGQSNLRLRQMGRRYFCTLLMIWFERLLIHDDLMTERRNRPADVQQTGLEPVQD
jgi:dolichol-phosphate mannosyltransferase